MTDDNTKTASNLGGALVLLREGKKVGRLGWNAHHMLGLQIPDANSANTLPYIYMIIGTDAKEMGEKRIPWVCSQTDMLAEDWIEIYN